MGLRNGANTTHHRISIGELLSENSDCAGFDRGVPMKSKSKAAAPQVLTSKIIKAGALIADTKTMLANWDTNASVSQNINHLQTSNLFGKASRSRIEDILAVFRQRYLESSDLVKALIALTSGLAAPELLDSVLYYYTAMNDSLVKAFVLEFVWPRYEKGFREVPLPLVKQWICDQVVAGRTTNAWSAKTIERCAQGLVCTLRDFRLLDGAVAKSIIPRFTPIPAVAFIAFAMAHAGSSARQVVDNEDWRLFLMQPSLVSETLLEANQHHLLAYNFAGSVQRLDFPGKTLEEYAHVVIGTANR